LVPGGPQEEKYTVVVVKSGNKQGHGKILEEVEESRAIFEVYEGGVVSTCFVISPSPKLMIFVVHASGHHLYRRFHDMTLYPTMLIIEQVQEVNHDTRTAQVIQADVNWITSPRYFIFNDSVLLAL
jgi:DEAD/DEAH box helicase domain-containing protein